VPEQHTEVGAVVVRRDEETAVHVGMASRLVAQQTPDGVDIRAVAGVLAPVRHARAGNLRNARHHDPKRLTGRVVVDRRNPDGITHLISRPGGR
jgi:hypothetical protein